MTSRHTDLSTKKFTFTLPALFAIISACSAIIGGYWWAKTTIANLQQSVDIANNQYADVKSEVKLLREQMYEIAFLYNRNIANENELSHVRSEQGIADSVVGVTPITRVTPNGVRRNSMRRDGVRFVPKRDTIDLTAFKRTIR